VEEVVEHQTAVMDLEVAAAELEDIENPLVQRVVVMQDQL
jgi:hypothetical protein